MVLLNLWSEYGHAFSVFMWSMLLGGMIGIERQWRQRLAGVRTNALVSMGAAAFTLFAALLPNPGVDSVARVAAQVVSGIGFLGAGVIMRDGFTVHGLTTAATLWCAAAVGVLVGSGLLPIAAIGAVFILGVNLGLRPVSRAIDAKRRKDDPKEVSTIDLIVENATVSKEVRRSVTQYVDVSRMQWISWVEEPSEEPQVLKKKITVQIGGLEAADPNGHNIMQTLLSMDGVESVHIRSGKT